MKSVRSLLLIPLLVMMNLEAQDAPVAATPRLWTDSAGRQIEATLHGFENRDNLILRLADGRLVPFPLTRLSPADREHAVEAFSKQPAASAIDWKAPKSSENFVIRGVTRQNAPGFVSTKTGWELRVKCIEARVHYKGADRSAPGNVSAYFYNREGKLIEKMAKPPRRQDENRVYIDAPESFKSGDTVEVYFPLTPFLEESGWATVLIAFGNGKECTVATMPASSYEMLAFDEKKLVFPDWKPDESAPASTAPAAGLVTLEIRRMREETFPYSIVFNGGYKSRKPCVSAEVRALGEVSPGNGVVKLYAFDKDGKPAGSRTGPSTAEPKGDAVYVGRPSIANSDWHPVYFALDREWEGKSHPTYVLVFSFEGKTIASVESSTGATLATLDFPEKGNLKP